MDERNQNSTDSIIIGNCLSCQGLVRVPSTAPAKSIVRCPHCSESFQLFEILNQSVPELELVSEIPAVAEEASEVPRVDQIVIKTDENREASDTFVVPPQLAKGARRSRRRSSSASGNMSSGNSQPSSRAERTGESSRQRPRARRPRERNSAVEAIKVVMGGLLAIPIAYLVVFWLFKQDPLDLGPKIGNVAPFLVPEQFHGDPEADVSSKNVNPTEESDIDSSKPKIRDVAPDQPKTASQ